MNHMMLRPWVECAACNGEGDLIMYLFEEGNPDNVAVDAEVVPCSACGGQGMLNVEEM